MDKIPVLDLTPEIEDQWDALNEAFQRVLRSGHFIMGPEVKAFEAEVAKYLGAKHAIGVNSGTDALVIALRAAGIGPGDEVITTPFSFFATAESISAVGAEPVFADVEEHSFNVDPDRIEPLITERTRAIMPVHLFGRPAEMDRIMAVAEGHDLIVVEDCAQSFGARYFGAGGNGASNFHGRMTGTIGQLGCYSFFPSKNLGAFGDGGLITTDDDRLADLARMLRTHGSKKKYHNEMIGYNSRLDAIQAAILRVKLPHIDKANEGRRRAAEEYGRLLGDADGVIAPAVVNGHVFHQYTVRIMNGRRGAVAASLSEAGIDSMVYYPIPQNRLPVYDGIESETPVSDQLASEVLSLPIWPSIGEDVQERVTLTLKSVIGETEATADHMTT